MHEKKKCLGTKTLYFWAGGSICQRPVDKEEKIILMKARVSREEKKIETMEGDLYGHQRSTGTNFHALAFLPGKDEV